MRYGENFAEMFYMRVFFCVLYSRKIFQRKKEGEQWRMKK